MGEIKKITPGFYVFSGAEVITVIKNIFAAVNS